MLIIWKETKAAERILKSNVSNGKCGNIQNSNKTVIVIPQTLEWSIFVCLFVFLSHPLLIKNFTNLPLILFFFLNLLWVKNRNAQNLKIKYQQKGAKLKCSKNEKSYIS